jgi:hypothetical protein
MAIYPMSEVVLTTINIKITEGQYFNFFSFGGVLAV